MDLVLNHWDNVSLEKFQSYLKSLINKDRVEWETKIINTNYPVLALGTKKVTELANKIVQGNYIEFLDANLHTFYENLSINAIIINKIHDYDMFKFYLLRYSKFIDNWASCDCIKFPITKQNKEKFFGLAKKLLKSKLPFERRLGIVALLKFIDDSYIDKVLEILNSFQNETHYYVNMALAWVFCDCFIKQPEKTKAFLENNNLNKFVINKGISKCRDSFRISQEDKQWLLQFKK